MRLAATPSSCLALLVIYLLVEVTLIDLEAGDIQRFGQRDIALDACSVCRRAESLHPVCQLGQLGQLSPQRHTFRVVATAGLSRPALSLP
jgi:hypothetical protein